MNKRNQADNGSESPDRPDWRRAHHSPLFWIGAALFLAAISIYIGTDDLSWRPRIQAQ